MDSTECYYISFPCFLAETHMEIPETNTEADTARK